MVQAFSQQSAKVFFCDVDGRAGAEVARRSRASFSRIDLVREGDIRTWIRSLCARSKQIDVLINNAAYDPRVPLAGSTVKFWDDLFARNLRAAFLTSREASPAMRSGSAIINFSSITFHIAPAAMTAYVATKAGIIGLTRALARELGPRGIRVNTISPGWVMTERQLRQFVTPVIRRLIRRSQCIPELIQPEEIANIALFLASDASSAITGQEILADRGWQFS
jgi:NAD(P)-dependent dehydrogenase (short-subunit alcohol dehydrogenase family)